MKNIISFFSYKISGEHYQKRKLVFCLIMVILTMLPFGYHMFPFGQKTNYGTVVVTTTMIQIIYLLIFAVLVEATIKTKIQFNRTYEFSKRIYNKFYDLNEKTFVLLITIIPIIICVFLGKVLWDFVPIVTDSIAQYAHAKLLSAGEFSVPTHIYSEFFPMQNVITNGEKWYSQYQIGHLIFLAIGHLINAPYIICPILTGLSALILYLFALEHYNKKTAKLTALLTMLCTQWWYMGSEYMNHNTSLFGCLLFVFAWLRLTKTLEWKYSILSGLGFGIAIITRPLTTVAMCLPFSLYGLYKLFIQSGTRRFLLIFVTGLVVSAFIILQLYFNQKTTGNYFTFGSEKLYGNSIKYGFGDVMTNPDFSEYLGTAHSLTRGLAHLSNNFIALNAHLFSWIIPSLLFAFIGFFFDNKNIITKLMLLSWISLAIGYVPYFFQDICFGARFMYEATGFLIIATAIGLAKTPAILTSVNVKISKEKLNFIFLVILISGVFIFAFGPQKRYVAPAFRKNYAQEIDKTFPDNSLVFTKIRLGHFSIFAPFTDNNRVIYADDLGEKNQKLMDYYPTRTVFIEQGDKFIKIRDGGKISQENK